MTFKYDPTPLDQQTSASKLVATLTLSIFFIFFQISIYSSRRAENKNRREPYVASALFCFNTTFFNFHTNVTAYVRRHRRRSRRCLTLLGYRGTQDLQWHVYACIYLCTQATLMCGVMLRIHSCLSMVLPLPTVLCLCVLTSVPLIISWTQCLLFLDGQRSQSIVAASWIKLASYNIHTYIYTLWPHRAVRTRFYVALVFSSLLIRYVYLSYLHRRQILYITQYVHMLDISYHEWCRNCQ